MTYKDHNDIEVSYVLPCLNECKTIGLCIDECAATLRSCNKKGEIVVADNGSRDGTIDIARARGTRVIEVEKRGYGAALTAGITHAQGKYVCIADSDMSYEFGALPDFLRAVEENKYDVVIGCRFPRGGGVIDDGAMPFLNRYVGNPLLSFIARFLFSSDIIDFHCGIRFFDRQKVLELGLVQPGMEFATEFIVKAHKAGLSIGQIPVRLRKDRRGKKSHLRPFRDGLRHVSYMIHTWITFR